MKLKDKIAYLVVSICALASLVMMFVGYGVIHLMASPGDLINVLGD